MSIMPLPQFEADLKADQEAYEKLTPPKTLVVRFGAMRHIAEYPYKGDITPGCGTKLVVRTHRGVEMAEMLTSTCPNAGCSKSLSRKEMLEYIENSGASEYPFFEDGRVLRVATAQDMAEQSKLDAERPAMLKTAQRLAGEHRLQMKFVEAEPILGGNRLLFYFTAEDRIDFRTLVQEMAREFSTRIELRQVGARDEARLIADYERCGQHCCCKQFLKVLKPVSMRSAKVQKATLDPLKISGRCGRLMCCLRYEDENYSTLVKRLPKMKKRVGTPDGPGMVVDRQILTQLVLVRLEHDNKQQAYPVEELCPPDEAPDPTKRDPMRGMPAREARERSGSRRGKPKADRQDAYRERSQKEQGEGAEARTGEKPERTGRKRRRRRGKGKGGPGESQPGQQPSGAQTEGDRTAPAGESRRSDSGEKPSGEGRKRGRRGGRRRKRRGGSGGGGGAEGTGGSGGGGGGSPGGPGSSGSGDAGS